jgi:hypothetical protein
MVEGTKRAQGDVVWLLDEEGEEGRQTPSRPRRIRPGNSVDSEILAVEVASAQDIRKRQRAAVVKRSTAVELVDDDEIAIVGFSGTVRPNYKITRQSATSHTVVCNGHAI